MLFSKVWSLIKGFPGKLRTSRITLIITVLVVLAACGYGVWHYYRAAGSKSAVYTTAKAADGNVETTVSASGNLIALQNVALTFKTQGYVETCSVQLGDLVTTGQVLATEDPSDLQASLTQADATLKSAQANYNKLSSTDPQEITQAQSQADEAQTALDNAKSTLERDQQLLASGGASQSTVDSDHSAYQQAKAAYQSAEYTLAQDQTHADLAAAAASVENAQSQAEQAQSNLTDANIIAPFDGYIDTITGNPGMWTGGGAVSSGTSTATQFGIVLTSTQLLIDAYVNEADISKVSVGQAIAFTVDTYPSQTFTGKLIALSPNATTVSNVQEYEAHMSIDNYSTLKSGMPATITIITASATNVLLIPESALSYGKTYQASLASGSKKTAASQKSKFSGSATASKASTNSTQSTGTVVLLVNGKPQIKSVQTGLSDGVNTEIVSGLNVADVVITGSTTAAKTSTATTSTSSTTGSTSGGATAIRL
jgi:HlyD family secretion protein